jgi:hypothetical protein
MALERRLLINPRLGTGGGARSSGTRVLISGQTGVMVRNALLGAKHRSSTRRAPNCWLNFMRRTAFRLPRTRDPHRFLSSLWFVDGDDDRSCRTPDCLYGRPHRDLQCARVISLANTQNQFC